MRKVLILILSLLITGVEAKPIELRVAKGRISLIDLGTLSSGKSWLVDKNFARIYELSALDNEEDKNIIAIQGLKESGETDLTVNTKSGIVQFHLIAATNGMDLALNPGFTRTQIKKYPYSLYQDRSTIVRLPSHINEYVLAGDPDLVKLELVNDFYADDFLKTFALVSTSNLGLTDIVVPTRKGVYKFSIEIVKGENNEKHHSNIVLHAGP